MKKLKKLSVYNLKRFSFDNLDSIYGGKTSTFCDEYTGVTELYPCGDVSHTQTDDNGTVLSSKTERSGYLCT